MKSFLTLLATVIVCISVEGHASDWQFAGLAHTDKVDTHQFLDFENVSYAANNSLRVWVYAITQKELDRHYKQHEKEIVEKATRKVARGYIPKFFQLESIKKRYGDKKELEGVTIETVASEVQANSGDIVVSLRMYWEIDCSEKRNRLLDLVSRDEKANESRKRAGLSDKWEYIAPDTNGEWLSLMLCKKKL